MSQEAANNSNSTTAADTTNWSSNSVSYPPLEGTEGHGHPRPQSLHDFFQFLSHVPLYTAADPPVPRPVSPHLDAPSTSLFFDFDESGLGPTHSIAPLDHQGTEVKDVDLKGKHKLIEPHGLRDSAGVGLKVDDIDISKGWTTISNAKGKQPLESNETHKLYQKSRRSSQKRTSEHRRRERINERMKALRALIPHCYKGDYASILDHAIDYIKSLKLQIDIDRGVRRYGVVTPPPSLILKVMSRSMGERQVQDGCGIQTMTTGARMPPALFGIGASSVPWSWEFQLFPRYLPLVHPIFQTPAAQMQTQAQAHLPLAPFLYTRPLRSSPETQSRPNPTLLSSFIRPATTTYDQAAPHFHPPTST